MKTISANGTSPAAAVHDAPSREPHQGVADVNDYGGNGDGERGAVVDKAAKQSRGLTTAGEGRTVPPVVKTVVKHPVVKNLTSLRVYLLAGLVALVATFTLGGATPALAAQTPATGATGATGVASIHTPATPTAPEQHPQEAEEESSPDPQYVTKDTSSDATWIILGVIMMIVLVVLGVGLAALGLSAE